MSAFPIIDADGHLLERDDEIEHYFDGAYAGYRRHQVFSLFPSLDGWPRGAVKGLKKAAETTPQSWLDFMDRVGIDQAVIYPTAGLALGLIQDVDWACALARAYNNCQDCIMYPSDFPHERAMDEFGKDIPTFLERSDLSEAVKRKILRDNARRFYGLA